MIKKELQKNKGFALLFAVTLAAILLSVALGITSVAMKEVSFSTSAKDTNDAFFAADSGAECTLFYDQSSDAKNAFTGTASMNCTGSAINFVTTNPWSFIVPGLDSTLQGCAVVTITKTNTPTTLIVSKGHNNGSPTCVAATNTVERQLEINY